MSDTNLNINIKATDTASASIKELQSVGRGLEGSLRELGAIAANSSAISVASIQREIEAIRAKIGALRQEIAVKEEASSKGIAAARAEADYINRDLNLRVHAAQQQLSLRNAVAREERKIAEDTARFEAEQINKSLALREASARASIATHNARVYAERTAEDAAIRAEAGYINRDKDLASGQTRGAASYENRDRDLAAAQARAEATYINQGMDAVHAKARAEADYASRNLGLIEAQRRTEAEYINQGMTAVAAKARAEAEYANRQRDLIASNRRAEAEYINRNSDLAYSAMRREADLENTNFNLRAAQREREAAAAAKAALAQNEGGALGILGRPVMARHVVAEFDSLASGRRGQAIATLGAAARDAGLGVGFLSTAMVGLAAVVGVGAILRGAEHMGKWATESKAAASAAGMSLSSYSQLQGALALSGMKADEADAALRRVAINLGTAIEDPTSKAAEAFHNLGIGQEQLAGTGGNVSNVLMLLADAFARTEDGANKSAAMNEIAGRGFEKLIPALQGGKVGLIAMEEEAKKLGITLDDTSAKKMEEAGQAVEHLGETVRGQGIQQFANWADAIKLASQALEGLLGVIGRIVGAIPEIAKSMPFLSLLPPQLLDRMNTGLAESSGGGKGRSGVHVGELISVPPMKKTGGEPSALQAMREEMVQAALAASQTTKDPKIARQREAQAEIDVMNRTLATALLTNKERTELETEFAQKQIQLNNEIMSAGVSAAKQTYLDFAASKKLEIAEAEGSSVRIKAIYEEWISAAKGKYQQLMSVVDQLRAKEIEAVNAAKRTEIRADVADIEQQSTLLKLNTQLGALASGTAPVKGAIRGPSGDFAQAATDRGEAQGIEAEAQTRIAAMRAAGATAKELLAIEIQAKSQEVALYQKAADASQAAVNKIAAPWLKLADSIGSEFEGLTTSLMKTMIAPHVTMLKQGLTSIKVSGQGDEIRSIFRNVFMKIAGDFGTAVESAIGNMIANVISKGAANTMGELISQTLSKALASITGGAIGSVAGTAAGGAGSGAISSTAIVSGIGTELTALGTSLSAAIATSSTAIVTAITGGAAATVAAVGTDTVATVGAIAINTANPEIFGFKAERGAVIPSFAAGGLVGGGSLSILHPKEMVLPAHISEGIQNMFQSGGRGNTNNNANLNYSPTINNGPRGRSGTGMSRAELSQVLGLHGGALLGEARNLMRSGWRPA